MKLSITVLLLTTNPPITTYDHTVDHSMEWHFGAYGILLPVQWLEWTNPTSTRTMESWTQFSFSWCKADFHITLLWVSVLIYCAVLKCRCLKINPAFLTKAFFFRRFLRQCGADTAALSNARVRNGQRQGQTHSQASHREYIASGAYFVDIYIYITHVLIFG